MVDPRVLAVQLAGLRAQVGALQAQIDAIVSIVELALAPAETPACTHPETEFVGTLGRPARRCLNPRCQAVLDVPRDADDPVLAGPSIDDVV